MTVRYCTIKLIIQLNGGGSISAVKKKSFVCFRHMSMMLLNETVILQNMIFLDLYKTNSCHVGIGSIMVREE